MGELEDATEAYLLQGVADATDRKLPCPPLTFTVLGKFAVKGWIQNVGAGVDSFVITEAGRQALANWKTRNQR